VIKQVASKLFADSTIKIDFVQTEREQTMYTKRIEILLHTIKADTAYITSPENLQYYSGFTGGEAWLVITQNERLLFTDSRYLIQAAEEAPDFTVVDIAKTRSEAYLKEHQPALLGYEEEFMTAKSYEALKGALTKTEWLPMSETILRQRAVKDEAELRLTREAARLADEAFAIVLPKIRVGMTENDVAMELEWYMRKNGASAPSFPIVCASGYRSAMPHGVASDKKLESGDFLTMDFGCFVGGYASDMTRTVVLGKASDEQKRVYETVLSAQKAAVQGVIAGKTGKEVDGIARNIIKDAGYGDYFGHALGHGTGLMIHERPVLSPRSEEILVSNMLVTVEPGIYIENFGGVRIEDLVIVTENGCENLTSSPKELLEL